MCSVYLNDTLISVFRFSSCLQPRVTKGQTSFLRETWCSQYIPCCLTLNSEANQFRLVQIKEVMWIKFFFFFSVSSRKFFVCLLSSEAWSICFGMCLSADSNTNLHPPNSTFCIVPVRKIYHIWYGKKKGGKEQILKIVLKWGFESSGVTSGESLTEESRCLPLDRGQIADKSEFTSRSTLKDDTFEKSVN